MTEAEAYAVHGWPLEGDRLILPVTGSGLDYTPYVCSCGARYVAVTGTSYQCYCCANRAGFGTIMTR